MSKDNGTGGARGGPAKPMRDQPPAAPDKSSSADAEPPAPVDLDLAHDRAS